MNFSNCFLAKLLYKLILFFLCMIEFTLIINNLIFSLNRLLDLLELYCFD